ncbi:hypothetical protein F5B20DRAFT_583299 [Whalleya microplaca]|nr:hypothetical protein F5B20DRAFT_583299 [Whalleya microplaca]
MAAARTRSVASIPKKLRRDTNWDIIPEVIQESLEKEAQDKVRATFLANKNKNVHLSGAKVANDAVKKVMQKYFVFTGNRAEAANSALNGGTGTVPNQEYLTHQRLFQDFINMAVNNSSSQSKYMTLVSSDSFVFVVPRQVAFISLIEPRAVDDKPHLDQRLTSLISFFEDHYILPCGIVVASAITSLIRMLYHATAIPPQREMILSILRQIFVVKLPQTSPEVFGLAQNSLFTGRVINEDELESLPGYEVPMTVWKLGDELGIEGLCDEAFVAVIDYKLVNQK